MSQQIKRVWNMVTTIFVVLIVLLAILLVGVRLVGIKPYTVLSGSMEPTYHVGSLIYVKEVDPLTLQEGDPVTFMLNENTVATHRIIERIPDETDPTVVRFRTQGDNNDTPDGELLHCKNVIGKPLFTIPYLGYLANYIQNPPGRFVALGACVLLLLAVIFSGSDKKTAPKEETTQNGEG
ncbi:MAG: signal peptidase I [Clostridia bacterium]|nr:signal peptidase I [Clostridia bacterium]